jgi:iron complex transport system substrate-binding protein
VPLNIVAVEAVARWVRPEIFGDLDPGATLAEINSRFSALPFDGALWVSLDPARDGPGPR